MKAILYNLGRLLADFARLSTAHLAIHVVAIALDAVANVVVVFVVDVVVNVGVAAQFACAPYSRDVCPVIP